MSDERELQRHNKILEQIENAEVREDLPNVSFSTIASYLASNVYFNGEHISQMLFKPVIDELLEYGTFDNKNVKNAFIEVVTQNFLNVRYEDIIDKYNKILSSPRIGYILSEIAQKNLKLDKIVKFENKKIHEEVLNQISNAFEENDLPKVGLGKLNEKILRAVNYNDFVNDLKTDDIRKLTEAYLNGYNYVQIADIVGEICNKQDLSVEDKASMKLQILGSLMYDETIDYTKEEYKLKEARRLKIYEMDHEETMRLIKEAHRISQLPENLTTSTLTGYLNGNTTIYSNDDRVTSSDLKRLTDLLFDGYKWEDQVIKDEIKSITDRLYSDKPDAYELLYKKLSVLPKTYYLVEEIEYSQERQREFIGNSCSNVNVYFVPNPKSPIEAGRFYNCYINRVDNLNLDEILPLDLDTIVPPKMDIDSVEWYVQEHADPTFKAAGGVILNRDETIGNVNIFRPNDGKVGVTKEEKEKMDTISDLDKEIEQKQEELSKLNSTVEEKEKQSSALETKMKSIISNYEKKALVLQMEMLKQIEELKSGIGYTEEDEEKGKEKKYE